MDTANLESPPIHEPAAPTLVAAGDGAVPIDSRVIGRPEVRGKFLHWGDRKQYVRGVTYGTFRPNSSQELFPERDAALEDLRQMAAAGFNSVRTYTPPPGWLLDGMAEHGLKAMVGLPWEQHITFLDSARRASGIRKAVRKAVAECKDHPAILCYAIGNEIPAPIVRWHGRDAVAEFLSDLYDEVKSVDPGCLATYVNYPTTEFLELPFLDVVACNVYLERPLELESYLARLHNLADERPLIMAEIGLDSLRNGSNGQAESLEWQIRASYASGCAGVFVFKWTDEWYRGGNDIHDWAFGLTDAQRNPKPALSTVSRVMLNIPFEAEIAWPRISVVVCSHNGSATIRDTLASATTQEYPNYEVIVVNDGSTDDTEAIAQEYPCRVVSTPNRGLSSARNEGADKATGEIVAYVDDDAYPDKHWLQYLADAFRRRDVCGVGGPNLLPPEDGLLAECISHAPGGPCHVLQTDDLAEHIPGCNMAFRKAALDAVGGFDRQFVTAGDDVDLCWRMLQKGWKIGFHPGAVVWHHRRPSIRRYCKQQFGYGRAEALLERKWPEKYNRLGHIPWSGRIYGRGLTKHLAPIRSRIYQGTWGQAAFQPLYQPTTSRWLSVPLMPEWLITIGFLAILASLSLSWAPLSVFIPILILAIIAPVVQAIRSAFSARLDRQISFGGRMKRRTIIAWLHIVQPVARLYGRLRHGLTVWRRRGAPPLRFPLPRTQSLWSEKWRSTQDWLEQLESALKTQGAVVFRGGEFDRWDLEIKGGFFGSARVLMTVEEHGSGRQMVRMRVRPVLSSVDWTLVVVPGVLGAASFSWGGTLAGIILGLSAFLMILWQLGDCSAAITSQMRAFDTLAASTQEIVDSQADEEFERG